MVSLFRSTITKYQEHNRPFARRAFWRMKEKLETVYLMPVNLKVK
jgi:hypothetical protein